MNCLICHTEITLTQQNQSFHDECRNCIYCGNFVGLQVVEKLIREEDGQKETKILIYHQPCRNTALEADFKKKPVIITQEHLDMLNRSHLFMNQVFNSDPELAIVTNQEVSEKMSNKWFNEMDLDQKFRALKNLEAITARCSILLSKDKNAVQTRIQAREIAKYQEVKEYREQQVTQKAINRTKTLTEIEKSNEKANPQLKARRKAIDAFVKFGISEAEAIKMVDGSNKPN